MEEGIIKITPDKKKAESILKMVDTTLEMVRGIDIIKFSSNVTKEYYEIIRELISIILLLDGYKVVGEGAHKRQIEYLKNNYKEFNTFEILLIDDLRIIRNRVAYNGFFIKESFLERKLKDIEGIIKKLKAIIRKKLND